MRKITVCLVAVLLLTAAIAWADDHPDPGVFGLKPGEAVIVQCLPGEIPAPEPKPVGTDGEYVMVLCREKSGANIDDGHTLYLPIINEAEQ